MGVSSRLFSFWLQLLVIVTLHDFVPTFVNVSATQEEGSCTAADGNNGDGSCSTDPASSDNNASNTDGGSYPHRKVVERKIKADPLQAEPTCKDVNDWCSVWADQGECLANPVYMRKNCRVSCGLCDDDVA